ncbi:MAG TPA: family 10 glycosylhydrolase [Candidatus Paceibacterota bacterium]|nr:family 10 glycosylhydrolase [Candidatus Paceibacterota bacterium]
MTRPPAPLREYRAAWVATVGNIDWPSSNRLSVAAQKAELTAILDRAAKLKLNAVIFQVRPGCDALYASTIEPWSEYLTGEMGKAPEPFYDPLAFAIDEAHKRGLELHAWFNPYRARHASAQSPVSPNHVSKTRPSLVREYGRYLWLDPGEKAVQDYSLSVVMDVVRRYDVDGVHFDDYFYPYKERGRDGKELDFPDDASWERYGKNSGFSRDDWRRENVNRFIERVYSSVKSAKPWVKFGVSPFGIWRPGNPPQIKGFDAYASLYADARKWLEKGWVDYFAPQLYWAIEPPEQSYPVLLKWWAQQNARHRHLVPGLNSTQTRRRWQPEEILNQIRIARKQPGASGHIHWNMSSLLGASRLADALAKEVYAQPALIPAAPWLDQTPPGKPRLGINSAASRVSWESSGSEPAALWLLQTRDGSRWSARVLPGSSRWAELDPKAPSAVALSAVDRYGNLSSPAVLERRDK